MQNLAKFLEVPVSLIKKLKLNSLGGVLVLIAAVLVLPLMIELFLGLIIHQVPNFFNISLPHSKFFSEDRLPQEFALKQSRRKNNAAVVLLGDCLIYGHGQNDVAATLQSLKPYLQSQQRLYNFSELGAVPATMLSFLQENASYWQNKTLVVAVAPIAFQHDYNEMYSTFKKHPYERDRLTLSMLAQSSLIHWWHFSNFYDVLLSYYERNFSDVNYMLLKNQGTVKHYFDKNSLIITEMGQKNTAPKKPVFSDDDEQKLAQWGATLASKPRPLGWVDFWKQYRSQMTRQDWSLFYRLLLTHTYLFQLKQAVTFFYFPKQHSDYANNFIVPVNYPAANELNDFSPALLYLDQIAKIAEKNKIALYFTLHPAPLDSYSAEQRAKWETLKKNLGLILWAAGYNRQTRLHTPVYTSEAFENGYYLTSQYYSLYLKDLAFFINKDIPSAL